VLRNAPRQQQKINFDGVDFIITCILLFLLILDYYARQVGGFKLDGMWLSELFGAPQLLVRRQALYSQFIAWRLVNMEYRK